MIETDAINTNDEIEFNFPEPDEAVAAESEEQTDQEAKPQAESDVNTSEDSSSIEADINTESDEHTKKQKAAEAYKAREAKRKAREAELLAKQKADDEAKAAELESKKIDDAIKADYFDRQRGPMPDVNDDKYLNDDGTINNSLYNQDTISWHNSAPKQQSQEEVTTKTDEQRMQEARLQASMESDVEEVKSLVKNFDKYSEGADKFLGDMYPGANLNDVKKYISYLAISSDGDLNSAKIQTALSNPKAQKDFKEAFSSGVFNGTQYSQIKFLEKLQSKYFDEPMKTQEEKRKSRFSPPPQHTPNGTVNAMSKSVKAAHDKYLESGSVKDYQALQTARKLAKA